MTDTLDSTQNIELKAGQLVVFSTGEYSDYGYRGSYVVLRDVPATEMVEIADQVRAEVKAEEEKTGWSDGVHQKFQAALIRRACLADINLREIHLGSYGELDLS
jgi:hypothetical protein